MTRTDRLYALVEELRAVAPRPRSATWLARRFEVSVRTVERDLDSLRQSGVPIWTRQGRTGGYSIDREHTLPPLMLSPEEALALSIMLRAAPPSPFTEDARAAALKLRAVLPADIRRREETLATRVHMARTPRSDTGYEKVVRDSVRLGQVLQLTYLAPPDRRTRREVEPLGLLWGDPSWYLLGWCRLRDALRGFRLDRIVDAVLLDETAPQRPVEVLDHELDRIDAHPLSSLLP